MWTHMGKIFQKRHSSSFQTNSQLFKSGIFKEGALKLMLLLPSCLFSYHLFGVTLFLLESIELLFFFFSSKESFPQIFCNWALIIPKWTAREKLQRKDARIIHALFPKQLELD